MSTKIKNLVLQRYPGGGRPFNVMWYLADQANDKGHTNLKQPEIARIARASLRHTRRAIQMLERGNWIRVVRYNLQGLAHDYYINIEKLEALPVLPFIEDEDGQDRRTKCPPGEGESQTSGFPRQADIGGKSRRTFSTGNRQDCGKNGAQADIGGKKVGGHLHIMIMNHDLDTMITTSCDHDGKSVENSSQTRMIFPEEPKELGKEFNVSIARRFSISDEDEGGTFSPEELVSAYLQVTQNKEKPSDITYADKLVKIPLSLAAMMFLMQEAIPRAKQYPGSLGYFHTTISNLWRRADDYIIETLRATDSTEQEEIFEKMQQVVREVIEEWVG